MLDRDVGADALQIIAFVANICQTHSMCCGGLPITELYVCVCGVVVQWVRWNWGRIGKTADIYVLYITYKQRTRTATHESRADKHCRVWWVVLDWRQGSRWPTHFARRLARYNQRVERQNREHSIISIWGAFKDIIPLKAREFAERSLHISSALVAFRRLVR